MKKKILFIIIFLTILVIFLSLKDKKSIYSQGKIVDLSSQIEDYEKNRERQGLLIYTTQIPTDKFYESAVFNGSGGIFQLDKNNSESRMLLTSYSTDFGVKINDPQYPGGFLMIKRLPSGKDSIFWEITSTLFGKGSAAYPIQVVEDINKDGSIDVIVPWHGGVDDNDSEFWIFSLDLENKKYKILNVVVDEKGSVIKDFDFEHPDPTKKYLNRFQSHDGQSSRQILKDFEGDGIYEIVIKKPVLERYSSLPLPNNISTFNFTQIYKWNGVEYYLWKEIVEPDSEYFWKE